jgi:septal ring-binding cell division protein DamX
MEEPGTEEITHPPDAELIETGTAEIALSATGIRREDWVRQQREDSYTIQIGSVTNEDDLVKFIQAHGLENNTAYIRIVIDGVTRYNALYGVYSSYNEAEQAVAGLPEDIRRIKPWIRNFGILHNLLD